MATPMSPPVDSKDVEPYTMHVSSRYLDLTKKKLELTRMPREITLTGKNRWTLGTPKAVLEPLIDYWLEIYDWRAQEASLNSTLRQYRTVIQYPPPPSTTATASAQTRVDIDIEAAAATPSPEPEPLRIHFLHHRSESATAIPLLYCHTWPGSFLEISRCIDALVSPVETPTESRTWSDQVVFHVVAPSIPGFGFSDASSKEGFGVRDTAGVFANLMERLGYERFVVWGDGWGFKIARQLAMHYSETVAAVYTSHAADLPAPQALKHKDAWLKYQIAKLTGARFPWLSFGYKSSDFHAADMNIADVDADPVPESKSKVARTRKSDIELEEREAIGAAPGQEEEQEKGQVLRRHDFAEGVIARRPQTLAYGLCDSPVGLLAFLLDALKPTISYTASASTPSSAQMRHRSATILRHETPLMTKASPQPMFSPDEILNWTMMYWLPGPEANLRWLSAVEKEDCYTKYSEVPLGIGWYLTPRSARQSSSVWPMAGAASNQNLQSSSVPPSTGMWMTDSPTASTTTGSASPVWASAVQNIKWVKRRGKELKCGVPAWERSEEVVQDIREYFGLGRSEGWLRL